jgi:hypothetical protein
MQKTMVKWAFWCLFSMWETSPDFGLGTHLGAP